MAPVISVLGVKPCNAPEVIPPIAPAFRLSFRLFPASNELPAPATNPDTAAEPVEPAAKPNFPAAIGPSVINNAAEITTLPMVLLANFLTAFPIFLNTLLKEKNSGKPVRGLIVPAPPLSFSIFISAGVTWASIVSPFRPKLAMPPIAKPCGALACAPEVARISSNAMFNAPKNSGSKVSGSMSSGMSCVL